MPIFRGRIKSTPRLPRFALSGVSPGQHVPAAREFVASRGRVECVARVDVPLHVRPLDDLKEVFARLRVEEQRIVNRPEAPPRPVSAGPPPDDLVAEVLRPEDGVEQDLEIVPGRRIAVQVKRAAALEHASQLDEPRGHHRQVGQHVCFAEQLAKRPQSVRNAASRRERLLKRGGRGVVPAPRILERSDRTGWPHAPFRPRNSR